MKRLLHSAVSSLGPASSSADQSGSRRHSRARLRPPAPSATADPSRAPGVRNVGNLPRPRLCGRGGVGANAAAPQAAPQGPLTQGAGVSQAVLRNTHTATSRRSSSSKRLWLAARPGVAPRGRDPLIERHRPRPEQSSIVCTLGAPPQRIVKLCPPVGEESRIS
jgi:hypothetical protein